MSNTDRKKNPLKINWFISPQGSLARGSALKINWFHTLSHTLYKSEYIIILSKKFGWGSPLNVSYLSCKDSSNDTQNTIREKGGTHFNIEGDSQDLNNMSYVVGRK